MTEMMNKICAPTEESVYALALERVSLMFDRFDRVYASFSGGKDSTVVLNLILDEAARRSREKDVVVMFFDEEAVDPDTIAYVERVKARVLPLGVTFRWMCLPISHRNACSKLEPYWYPWAIEDQHRWCRPLPADCTVEADVPNLQRLSIAEMTPYLLRDYDKQIVFATGMRAQESMRRRRIAMKKEHDNWMWELKDVPHGTMAMPIYDWMTEDIWTAIAKNKWDYTIAYDKYTMLGVAPHIQRVCPPFGEEPLANLWRFGQLWPALWERMLNRVAGAATAGRYSRGPLYGFGVRDDVLQPGETWEQVLKHELDQWDEPTRLKIAARLRAEITAHNTVTNNAPIPIKGKYGLSWAFLRNITRRGDTKYRRRVLYPGAPSVLFARATKPKTRGIGKAKRKV